MEPSGKLDKAYLVYSPTQPLAERMGHSKPDRDSFS